MRTKPYFAQQVLAGHLPHKTKTLLHSVRTFVSATLFLCFFGARAQVMEQKIKNLGDQCFAALLINTDSAEFFCEEAFELASELENDTILAQALNDLGILRIRQSRYSEALELNKKALEIRRKLGLKREIGASLSKIGIIYLEQAKYAQALPIQHQALEYFIEAGDSSAIGQTYSNLAYLTDKTGNLDQAIEYTGRAIEILEATENLVGLAGAYGNLSLYHERTADYEKALKSIEKAVEICIQLGLKHELAGMYNNMGFYHRKNNNSILGKAYYETALELAREGKDTVGMVLYQGNIAQVELEQGLLEEAKSNFLEVLKMAEPRELLHEKVKMYRGLATVYGKQANFPKAYEYRTLEAQWNDSLFGKEKIKAIQELQVRFETERKEKELADLGREQALTESNLARQQTWTALLGGLAIVMIVIFLSVLYTRKKKAETRAANLQSEHRKDLLHATIDAQEEERQRIARDLHDGLVQSLVGIKIGLQNIQRKFSIHGLSEQLKRQVEYLDQASAEARAISHQMMPRALKEKGLIMALDDMLEKTLGQIGTKYGYETFLEKDFRFQPQIEIGLYRISQELVNNIIRHSGATEVQVQLYMSKEHLILHVEDNGKGMDGSGAQQGIGLQNILSRASVINGDATYDKALPTGTVANIRVPLRTAILQEQD